MKRVRQLAILALGVVGVVVAYAGPVSAGVRPNHCEPLRRK